MPRPSDFVSDAPRPERRCCICDGFPTLYFAAGKLYCKAHKADAEKALVTPPRTDGLYHEEGRNTHKWDQPRGISHAK